MATGFQYHHKVLHSIRVRGGDTETSRHQRDMESSARSRRSWITTLCPCPPISHPPSLALTSCLPSLALPTPLCCVWLQVEALHITSRIRSQHTLPSHHAPCTVCLSSSQHREWCWVYFPDPVTGRLPPFWTWAQGKASNWSWAGRRVSLSSLAF